MILSNRSSENGSVEHVCVTERIRNNIMYIITYFSNYDNNIMCIEKCYYFFFIYSSCAQPDLCTYYM